MFVINFLFLLILIRLIPGAIIFYIIFWDALKSPAAFYQVPSYLVLYDDIQYLTEAIPVFGDFLCLYIVLCLLEGPGEGVVLFEVAAMIFFNI